jgi:exodeoxyribonuclease V beta subunit
LTCVLPQPWKIASYSSLAHSHLSTETKLDEFIPEEKKAIDSSNVIHVDHLNIFKFPKGAKAGTFLHDLLEQIDLSNISDEILLKQITHNQLLLSGLDPCWSPVITELIKNIAAVQLFTEGTHFSLSDISLQNCIKEMEFYFPLNTITPGDLTSAFSAQMNLFNDNYSGEGLQFSPVDGFMKGFIDMVFIHNNRYYILDWKSNYLGSELNDYSEERLLTAMKSEHYVLQYHIYCVALDQYLKLHLPGYNYKNNFGGVFYIFLRGIEINSKTGIYFSKPDAGVIENLRMRMIEG